MNQLKTVLRKMEDRYPSKSMLFYAKSLLIAAAAVAVLSYNCVASGLDLVKPGDEVDIHFTCRLKSGEIAASSYDDVAADSSLPKSPIFIPRKLKTPITITAETNPPLPDVPGAGGFEGEILRQLSAAVVDREPGKKQEVELRGDPYSEQQKDEWIVKISRVRRRDKEIRFTPDQYKANTGRMPEVGQAFSLEPALPGRVDSVSETDVIIRFAPDPSKEIFTPFGKGTVKELPERYEIVIHALPGSLVRTGALVGRIVNVDESEITIDYGHPFGRESLRCDVVIESSKPGNPEKRSASISRAAGSHQVKENDLVRVHYTVALEDGSVIYSTRSDAAREPGMRRAAGYREPRVFGPEEVVAGKPALIPGVGQAVLGMGPGERKKITIRPEAAYGPSDPRKVQTIPTTQTFAKRLQMSPANFVQQFKVFPIQGKELPFSPYLKAKVKEVTETSAAVELFANDGEQFDNDFGSVAVRMNGDEVNVILKPRIGASFKTEAGEGTITGTDGKTFTVDFNSPLAGKTVVLDIEVMSITPASAIQSIPIPWIDDHDQGLAEAKRDEKPALLVLYADWCSWCKKLFNESFQDPRIKIMQDRLVWIKVNSDREKEYKERYKQDGFPLLLLLEPDGKVARRIDGFVDAAALREALGVLIDRPSKEGT
ncbi:MAG: FKBP-type peptidyl-prolyl cis-trans isomerase [Syntrophaceae bacterium]|nr:FKBP-type peptidyl-prolyl cis-trans isomerase [Syntrophaceae bacterium]